VKLVDAGDSKSPVRKDMSVRFRPPAPNKYPTSSLNCHIAQCAIFRNLDNNMFSCWKILLFTVVLYLKDYFDSCRPPEFSVTKSHHLLQ
jgi:hypothetical protein